MVNGKPLGIHAERRFNGGGKGGSEQVEVKVTNLWRREGVYLHRDAVLPGGVAAAVVRTDWAGGVHAEVGREEWGAAGLPPGW